MKKILFVSAAALLMWACSSEETAPVEEETIEEEVEATTTGRISIFPVFTKVSDETFEDGDQIGVTITKTGASSYYVWNKCLTYSASDGTFTGDVEWYSGTTTCTIVAYYPYQSSNVSSSGYPTSFSVATDQSEGISSSDFVMGTATEVSPSSDAVSIDFYHLLSRINVNVSNAPRISSITLSTPVIDCSVASSGALYGNTTDTLTLYYNEDEECYQAIVVPQTVTLTLTLNLSDKTTRTKALSSKTLAGGTEYDLNVSFSGLNGHEYVDLGLSSGLLWATYNVGATSTSEGGNFYTWGNTETSSSYSSTYSPTSGVTIAGSISGNEEYDTATYNWGSPWKMPTVDDWTEMLDGCSWTHLTTYGSYSGMVSIGVSTKNDNTIVLPYGGYKKNTAAATSTSYGYYWTSEPRSSTNTTQAFYANFNGGTPTLTSYNYRYYGYFVRPVVSSSDVD